MIKYKLTIAYFLSLLLNASLSFATPPLQERWQKLEQPNGTFVFVTQRGDRHLHWLETRSGYIVVKNEKSGVYEFAKIIEQDGKQTLVLSGIPANADQNVLKTQAFEPVMSRDLGEIRRRQVVVDQK